MAFNVDALIERVAEKEETFRVPTSDDPEEDIICKTASDIQTMMQTRAKAEIIFKMAPLPEWKPYLPISREVAMIVATITTFAVEPAFTDLQVLQMCKKAGMFTANLFREIMRRVEYEIPAREIKAIEAEKNGLGPMDSINSIGSTSASDTNISKSTRKSSPAPIGNAPASTPL